MKQNQDYTLSFTAASLMFFETLQIAKLYLKFENWDLVAKEVTEENFLQKGTVSTRKREFSEIKKRLIALEKEELEFIIYASSDELKLFCLYLCARTYRLIYEFIVEVIREKYLLYDYVIYDSDYTKFYESKKLSSPKLQKISQKTEYKLKQVIFRILEQAGLIDNVKTKNIQKPYISEEIEEIVAKYNPNYLSIFLYSNSDIKALKKEQNV